MNFHNLVILPHSTAAAQAAASEVKAGWVAGAGAEIAIDRSWSLRAEYLYVDFASVTASGVARSSFNPAQFFNPMHTSVDLSAHLVRLGLSYRY